MLLRLRPFALIILVTSLRSFRGFRGCRGLQPLKPPQPTDNCKQTSTPETTHAWLSVQHTPVAKRLWTHDPDPYNFRNYPQITCLPQPVDNQHKTSKITKTGCRLQWSLFQAIYVLSHLSQPRSTFVSTGLPGFQFRPVWLSLWEAFLLRVPTK